MTDSNKDEPIVDESTNDGKAKGVIAKAEAQAAKIIQSAEIRAKQIIEDAVEQSGGKKPESGTVQRRWIYNRKTGESKIINADDQTPRGWHSSPK